jgi:polysaccharide deacetylase 2 family uncharacterized protein YibQ
MATKNSKRRSRVEKIYSKGPLIIFIFCLGSIIILAFFHSLIQPNSAISPPVYEETHLISSDLNNGIGRIDNAIYESLYQRGISEKNIRFLEVKPKYERGYGWDFTELLIKLPKRNSVQQVDKIISFELSQLKTTVSWKRVSISKRELVYHIFALGFYTHKIRLICEEYQKKPHQELPKIAIIIDDLGYDHDIAVSFGQLDLPLSLSVLPLAPYTKSIVNEAKKRGCELILHLPMEPKNYPYLDPGPGALLIKMSEKEIRKTIGDHLKRISGVRGVNNHMGSYFTEREDKMAIVLDELRKRNLFFIDSRTTSQTVAFELAKKMGVPVANRSVFLDNNLSPKAIKFQMERLLSIARHLGAAVGIGHPYKETLMILKSYLHKLKTDFEVVHVSELTS